MRDIERLERVVGTGSGMTAFAILLTNDLLYWDQPKRDDVTSEAFRIHQGKVVNGTLDWAPRTAESTKAEWERITIQNRYVAHWNDYSLCNGGSYGEFR